MSKYVCARQGRITSICTGQGHRVGPLHQKEEGELHEHRRKTLCHVTRRERSARREKGIDAAHRE